MKHLPRENTIWEFLRAPVFMIFGTCFKVNSKIHILSMFYQIILFWELHFGPLGPTFWGLFFRSRKTPEVLLPCAPGSEPSSTPPGEGGNWKASGMHLGDIWEASGRHLGDKGQEEVQRRLGLKKLIDVCSQMQKLLLFINFTRRF